MEESEYLQGKFCQQFTSDTKMGSGDHFMVEDLLDFSNDDAIITEDSLPANSTDSSTLNALHTSNSSSFSDNFLPNLPHPNFSTDLCVPCDDVAELEWLSNFVEESFSSDDLQKLQLISGTKARNDEASQAHGFQNEPNRNNNNIFFTPEVSKSATRKKDAPDDGSGEGRKCLHCATDKTPQWRTGPMGPKTLCNACGVRYKSGRLVPEYRPAASPTFVLTKHSNSHRKVLELRRQKEMVMAQQHQQFLQHQNMMFDVSNGDDFLIHQHVGPDFRHWI
ncbi:GATA transcription factor 12-like [Senna tora]|uniref:GATA transcription factor n=1 Tax=Senna tora TaxID=362788 RepID=A0A834U1C2_9FABA|nr:GATA transcription factor 12-like [Senna tora]